MFLNHTQLAITFVVVPLLCAMSLEEPHGETGPDGQNLRYDLEVYVHQITTLVDLQIEELASMIPKDEVEKLRKDHYAWKLVRDARCAATSRLDPNPLSELECLSVATEEYYQEREAEIADLETERVTPQSSQ